MKSYFFFIALLALGLLFGTAFPNSLLAQEQVVDLPSQRATSSSSALRPTNISLPFFEDFTDYSSAPNPQYWQDHSVYLSNTMAGNHFSRGVAVFDANDAYGTPYDTSSPISLVWADSLTSQNIDLSGYQPDDSLWLSFYYEPGGRGYAPKLADSFMVFFRNQTGEWEKVWGVMGDSVRVFKRVMIPIKDHAFFHNQFALRFANKATHGISNSHWLLDYLLLDAHRNYQETPQSDLAFTKNGSSLLSDFTAMPWLHFQTNPASFLAPNLKAYLKNNGTQSVQSTYGYQSRETRTQQVIAQSGGQGNLSPTQELTLSLPGLTPADFNGLSSPFDTIILETQFYTNSVYANESKINDTIVQRQVFGNYFAYDDGTAEKAYFLNTFPNAPATTAIEYALYTPDTLRGVAIHFPKTVPMSRNKEFSLIIYKDIAFNGGRDEIVYQQDFFLPQYPDGLNVFTNYVFREPVGLEAGTYYVGILQSAGGFSDSLYLGLDLNRTGGNHRYFNVDGIWHSSEIPGALMVRPLVGGQLPATSLAETKGMPSDWDLFPNPSQGQVSVRLSETNHQPCLYLIYNTQGRLLQKGRVKNGGLISVNSLTSGTYFFRLIDAKGQASGKWLIKQ